MLLFILQVVALGLNVFGIVLGTTCPDTFASAVSVWGGANFVIHCFVLLLSMFHKKTLVLVQVAVVFVWGSINIAAYGIGLFAFLSAPLSCNQEWFIALLTSVGLEIFVGGGILFYDVYSGGELGLFPTHQKSVATLV